MGLLKTSDISFYEKKYEGTCFKNEAGVFVLMPLPGHNESKDSIMTYIECKKTERWEN